MNKHIEEIRNNYYVEKCYFDKIYLTDEESKIIKEMKNKKRKIYVKENKIYISETCDKYYKILGYF